MIKMLNFLYNFRVELSLEKPCSGLFVHLGLAKVDCCYDARKKRENSKKGRPLATTVSIQ